jgi:transcription elongation factor Elf1
MVAEEITPNPKVEAPDCPACGALMAFVATVPKLGGLPELRTFNCEVCGEVITNEVEG